jgi:hypothetical protein
MGRKIIISAEGSGNFPFHDNKMGLMLSRTKTHVRRGKSYEKSMQIRRQITRPLPLWYREVENSVIGDIL